MFVCAQTGQVVDVCANSLCGQAIKVGLIHDQYKTAVVQGVAVAIRITVGLSQRERGELRVCPEVEAFHIAIGFDGATDPTVIGVASDHDGRGRDVVATEHLASAVVIDAHISQRIAVIEVVQVLLFGCRRFCGAVDDAVVVQVIDHSIGIDEFEGRKFNLKGFATGCDPARIVVQGRFGSVTPAHQRCKFLAFIAWRVFAGVERGVQRVPEFFRQNLDNGFIVQNIQPKLAEKEGGAAFRPMGAESCHCAQVAGVVHGHQLWLKRARCKRCAQLGKSFSPLSRWRRFVG